MGACVAIICSTWSKVSEQLFLTEAFSSGLSLFILILPRNDEWNSDRPKEDGSKYDGPAGMEPDGVIDSNWDEVTTIF